MFYSALDVCSEHADVPFQKCHYRIIYRPGKTLFSIAIATRITYIYVVHKFSHCLRIARANNDFLT